MLGKRNALGDDFFSSLLLVGTFGGNDNFADSALFESFGAIILCLPVWMQRGGAGLISTTPLYFFYVLRVRFYLFISEFAIFRVLAP